MPSEVQLKVNCPFDPRVVDDLEESVGCLTALAASGEQPVVTELLPWEAPIRLF